MIQCPLLLASYIKFQNPSLPPQQVTSSTKQLHPLSSSFIGTDLSKYQIVQPSNDPESLDNVIRFIQPCVLPDTSSPQGKCTVVTWRGILTKIMTNEVVTLLACRHRNILFVREDAQGRRKSPFHPAENWGRAFEKVLVEERGANGEEHEFACVFKSRLAGIKLVYGAEVDCTDGAGKFVELKTSKVFGKNSHEEARFVERKIPKFWAQCYLVGIERLLVGFRDDNGVVRELRWFNTKEMQKQVPYNVSLKFN